MTTTVNEAVLTPVTNFLELWPGNALEAEVAEKVMGWKRWKFPDGYVALYDPPSAKWLPRYKAVITTEPYTEADTSMHRFSSDMNAVMKVVEQLSSQQGGSFTAIMHNNRKGEWLVEFWAKGRCKSGGWSPALPDAICRAALAAMENQTAAKRGLGNLNELVSITQSRQASIADCRPTLQPAEDWIAAVRTARTLHCLAHGEC